MKDFMLVILALLYFYYLYKYLETKKDLEFYKPKYEKIRKQYVELHSKFYEPIYSIDNGYMKIEWKLKDKYKEDVKNG